MVVFTLTKITYMEHQAHRFMAIFYNYTKRNSRIFHSNIIQLLRNYSETSNVHEMKNKTDSENSCYSGQSNLHANED